MLKCDACNKTVLIPERIGDCVLCNSCLLKINGIVWKFRKIDNDKNLEKNREKALELAKSAAFPEKVITGINTYFDNQKVDMKKCDNCGEVTQSAIHFGHSTLCKKCFSKIKTADWDCQNYFDRKELNHAKANVIKKAKKNKFNATIINDINDHFDNKVDKNWLYTIEGVIGQTLTIYEDYLVIQTTEDFEYDNIKKEYEKILSSNKKNLKSLGTELLGDVISTNHPFSKKNIVKTIAKMTTSSENSTENHENKINFYVRQGNIKVNYSDYDSINLYLPDEDEDMGFIVIRNSTNEKNSSSDRLFFFDDVNEDQIKKIFPIIEEKIESSSRINEKTEEKISKASFGDELRELKALLDEGIITKEEFEQKKKKILNLD